MTRTGVSRRTLAESVAAAGPPRRLGRSLLTGAAPLPLRADGAAGEATGITPSGRGRGPDRRVGARGRTS